MYLRNEGDLPPLPNPMEAALREAREALTAHGVLIRPEWWAEALAWADAAARQMPVRPEMVALKYLNVVRDVLHESFQRR